MINNVLGARDEKHPAICHDASHYVCCHCHIASGCNIKLTAVGVRIKHSDSTNAACLVAMPIPRGAYRVCDGQTASCMTNVRRDQCSHNDELTLLSKAKTIQQSYVNSAFTAA